MIDWEKTFPVISISRKDVSFADLTDADMVEIARRVKAEIFTPWELLEEIALEILQAKHTKEEDK